MCSHKMCLHVVCMIGTITFRIAAAGCLALAFHRHPLDVNRPMIKAAAAAADTCGGVASSSATTENHLLFGDARL